LTTSRMTAGTAKHPAARRPGGWLLGGRLSGGRLLGGRPSGGRLLGGDRRRWTRRARRVGLNLLGLLVALITLFPILWMVSTAFKPATEIYSLTPHPLPAHPTLSNFRTVINGSVVGLPYWNFLKNSLFVTLIAVVASSLIALLAAIAVARFRFRFRTTYLIMLLIVQMLPQQALVIALYIDCLE
jgi:N,N'-diacetylchitobiose transport system permease protein